MEKNALTEMKDDLARIVSEWEASDGLCSDAALAIVAYVFGFPRLAEANEEWDHLRGQRGRRHG